MPQEQRSELPFGCRVDLDPAHGWLAEMVWLGIPAAQEPAQAMRVRQVEATTNEAL